MKLAALVVAALLTVGCGKGERREAEVEVVADSGPVTPPGPGPGFVEEDGGLEDGGAGQPPEETGCRKAVENFARLRGLTLDPMQLRQFTLWCLDEPPGLAACIGRARGVRELERCEAQWGTGSGPGGFAEAAEAVGSRPRPGECEEAIHNLVKLVPDVLRDRPDFLKACLIGTRAQSSCVARARRAEDLSRCP